MGFRVWGFGFFELLFDVCPPLSPGLLNGSWDLASKVMSRLK